MASSSAWGSGPSLAAATRRSTSRSRSPSRTARRPAPALAAPTPPPRPVRPFRPPPPPDGLRGEQIARPALADDRGERDVLEEVHLPERLPLRGIGEVDLHERPLDPEQGVAQGDARRSEQTALLHSPPPTPILL